MPTYTYNGENGPICHELVIVGEDVINIPADAFFKCDKLESLTFESSTNLKTIGDRAFYECTSLTNVQIPANVNSIGQNAFRHCTALTVGLIWTHSHFTQLSIGESAFRGCTSMNGTLLLTGAFTEIGICAFGQTGFEELIVDNSFAINYLPDGVLAECPKLQSVTLPSNVIRLGDSAFSECISLTTFFSHSDELDIVAYAFSGCESLIFDFSNFSKLNIDMEAFSGCPSLTGTLFLTGAFTGIGEYAFSGSSFETVIVEDSFKLDKITRWLFFECPDLKSFLIQSPRSNLDFGDGSFMDCPSLKYFSCLLNSTFDNNPNNPHWFYFSGTNSIETVRFYGTCNEDNPVLDWFSDATQFPVMKCFRVPCDFDCEVRNEINILHIYDNGIQCFVTKHYIVIPKILVVVLSFFIQFQ